MSKSKIKKVIRIIEESDSDSDSEIKIVVSEEPNDPTCSGSFTEGFKEGVQEGSKILSASLQNSINSIDPYNVSRNSDEDFVADSSEASIQVPKSISELVSKSMSNSAADSSEASNPPQVSKSISELVSKSMSNSAANSSEASNQPQVSKSISELVSNSMSNSAETKLDQGYSITPNSEMKSEDQTAETVSSITFDMIADKQDELISKYSICSEYSKDCNEVLN
jgi:hypothetical protein